MRRRIIQCGVLMILVGGLCAVTLARDFWLEKPFTKWSESEAFMHAPSLDLADDEVIFVSELGKLKIRAVFKLARMVVDGKLDV